MYFYPQMIALNPRLPLLIFVFTEVTVLPIRDTFTTEETLPSSGRIAI
ncbi:MAG TPA: hypothetical protein PL061_11985 [Syntrophales bacterium]|jgi:hypothetical protein|nr:hypothetical protein [Syntrophales bacterium]